MGLYHKDWLRVLVRKWLGRADNMLMNDGDVSQHLAWRVGLKMAWRGRSTVEGGRPEREHYLWTLRGGRRREAVAGNNCVGASRARSIYVRAAK